MKNRKVYLIAILEADRCGASLTFEDATYGDYVVHAIFDYESDKFVFCDDNTHNDPYKFLDGFVSGVSVMGEEVKIEKLLLYTEGSPYNVSDVREALIKYFEEEE